MEGLSKIDEAEMTTNTRSFKDAILVEHHWHFLVLLRVTVEGFALHVDASEHIAVWVDMRTDAQNDKWFVVFLGLEPVENSRR